jgi:uncharacterized protein GlcG (DUF336 family)
MRTLGPRGAGAALLVVVTLAASGCGSDAATAPAAGIKNSLPTYTDLKAAVTAVQQQQNGGLGFNMWATIVDREGVVRNVVFTGERFDDQWEASRAISAQKANTANSLSLANFALSTANLYAAVQPGGSLFGLQESNPVDVSVAYKGDASAYGTAHDPMIGGKIGGVNVFGGGLALYAPDGSIIGALGLSGDTSCTDHIIAWKVRHALNLDNVPAGVADNGHDDNIIYDTDGIFTGFEHPTCFDTQGHGDHIAIGNALPTNFPIGPNP